VLASLDEQVLEQPADGLGGEALPLVLGGDGEADLAWRGSSADAGRAVADQPVGLVSSVKPVSAIVYPLRLARLAAHAVALTVQVERVGRPHVERAVHVPGPVARATGAIVVDSVRVEADTGSGR
jgi:hypothetical protein